MVSKILITGANVGLGFESARQLSQVEGVELIYLACRDPTKARDAKVALQQYIDEQAKTKPVSSAKPVQVEVCILELTDLASVRKAVDSLPGPIDGLVLNAGGGGGREFYKVNEDGVSNIMAVNLLGHVLMVDLLLKQKKLTGTVMLAGSEAARGLPSMGLAQPELKTGSVEEFCSICDGSFTKGKTFDDMYGPVKLLGTLWMSSMARKHPDMRFITVSPGATAGTNVAKDLDWKRTLLVSFFPILVYLGFAHTLDKGAKRYVDALTDPETYKTGVFYGSVKGATGPVSDQSTLMEDLNVQQYQENANIAIHKYLK